MRSRTPPPTCGGTAWLVQEDSSGVGPHGLDLARWFLDDRASRHDGRRGREYLRAEQCAVRAMVPIIRRKFHRTQRVILAALKQSLETQRHADDLGVRRS
jgi:hypothetical protein